MTEPLSPLRIRLVVFAVMIAVAVAAIWLIDRRAMRRTHEMEHDEPASTQPAPVH